MLGFSFSSQLGWGSIFEIESETKTASKKTGALVDSLKSISRQVALYLYKSIIRPGMEYSCHVLTLICQINNRNQHVGLLVLSLTSSSELSHYSLFLGTCLSELSEIISFPYSGGRTNCYFDRLYFFLSIFLYVISMPLSASFFSLLVLGIFCLKNAFL